MTMTRRVARPMMAAPIVVEAAGPNVAEGVIVSGPVGFLPEAGAYIVVERVVARLGIAERKRRLSAGVDDHPVMARQRTEHPHALFQRNRCPIERPRLDPGRDSLSPCRRACAAQC